MMMQQGNDATDLSLQDVYGNPILRSTANCYVVSKPGKYKFPLVYGNAIKNGQVNTAAFTNNGGSNSLDFVGINNVLISDNIYLPILDERYTPKVLKCDTEGVFDNLGIETEDDMQYLCFEVLGIPMTGANGVLGASRADWANIGGVIQSDAVHWSWHIWCWPHDLSPVEITNQGGFKYNIMPVNLASKYDEDMVHIKNWYYQWGKKDPILGPSSYNSSDLMTNYGGVDEINYPSNNWDSLGSAVLFPWVNMWYSRWYGNKSAYNLWDAACMSTGASDSETIKTVYDPCPVGWKIPNGNLFNGRSIISATDGVIKISRYSGDAVGVDIPMSGYRSNNSGSITQAGSGGYIWTSSPNTGAYANAFRIRSSGIDSYSATLSVACNVRPVEDNINKLDEL